MAAAGREGATVGAALDSVEVVTRVAPVEGVAAMAGEVREAVEVVAMAEVDLEKEVAVHAAMGRDSTN